MGQFYSLQNNRSGNKTRWYNIAIGCIAFWISASLLLDLIVMPTLWATGMMESSGFASAGYSIFWLFNRVELVCAATILSSIWAIKNLDSSNVYARKEMFAAAVMLFAIAVFYTFFLTPYMSGLGINLDLFDNAKSIPADMNRMHSIYWVLETSKLGIATMLLTAKD
jgi:hypothetical protein